MDEKSRLSIPARFREELGAEFIITRWLDGCIIVLPLDQLKPIEDSTNVLIFLCNRKGGQIPGKIYQYSATNKTILFIMDGTNEEQGVLRQFFGKFNRYVFCQNTKGDIARAISMIESGNLGGVENRPLDDFNPTITIENILKAGS
jgi:hypothetical protein